jgi:hypothetical protein
VLAVVFDVESRGLHGEGFAVGAVVVNGDDIIEEFLAACPPEKAKGTDDNLRWVKENCPSMVTDYETPAQVRSVFWDWWLKWKAQGAVLTGDCVWPVEANFLSACVGDNLATREWEGPYPLMDIAPIMWANGMNPLATHSRWPDELPAHHPLNDARQSARLLLQLPMKEDDDAGR